MNAYFSKMKRPTDSLAFAGKLIKIYDLIIYILTRLYAQDYESLVIILLAKTENMNLNDLYAWLLSHKMRIEQKKEKVSVELVHNPSANIV